MDEELKATIKVTPSTKDRFRERRKVERQKHAGPIRETDFINILLDMHERKK